MKKIVPHLCLLFSALFSCTSDTKKTEEKIIAPPTEELVPTIDYEILSKIPHDINSFTEGLYYHNNQLFESTGSPENLPQTKSVFGVVDTATGKIDVKVNLDRKYFGEGVVLLHDKIYQLTYTDQIGFIYDAKTYKQIGQFTYKNKEGWGMTTDGKSIIMSDGTNILTYLNPNTFKVEKTLNITNAGYAEDYLNELEFINGYIYANIWMKNYAVKIDTASGKVVGILDFSSLTMEARNKYQGAEALNGIAYDSITGKLFVTGKMFPNVYVLKLKEQGNKL